MIYNLHLLRALAALSVVYFHAASTSGLNLAWDVGSWGVDVFFVISGFIISYIGQQRPEGFFLRRLIRIVPFYWAATVFIFLMAAILPQYFRSTSVEPQHLLASLLFVPRMNPASGEMMPTLLLGWSLNFEMFFYLVYSGALLVSRKWAPVISVAAIVALVFGARAVDASYDVIQFWARPIVLEFCLGVASYYVFRWAETRRQALLAVPALKWLLLAAAVGAGIALLLVEHWHKQDWPRYWAAGLPSFVVVSSLLILERVHGVRLKSRWVFELGEASYIIYLIHPYIVFGVLRLWVRDAALSLPVMVGLLAVLLVSTAAVSVLIHRWFERPVIGWLKERLLPG